LSLTSLKNKPNNARKPRRLYPQTRRLPKFDHISEIGNNLRRHGIFLQPVFRKFDRTIDQMVQAARSGKQNIAEASMASGTSKETEIKLTNVARASLEELLIDYQDFLRTNKLHEWEKESRLVVRLRELNKIPNATYETFKRGIENENPEICTNVMIGLIKVTGYLLSHQLKTLETAFINEGGLRARMTAASINKRNKGK